MYFFVVCLLSTTMIITGSHQKQNCLLSNIWVMSTSFWLICCFLKPQGKESLIFGSFMCSRRYTNQKIISQFSQEIIRGFRTQWSLQRWEKREALNREEHQHPTPKTHIHTSLALRRTLGALEYRSVFFETFKFEGTERPS